MATTLPLLLFPKPANVTRSRLPSPPPPKLATPTMDKLASRLEPRFQTLVGTFDAERLHAQRQVTGHDPDLVLVLETAGPIEDFINAANGVPELEWLFGEEARGIQPDEDFFYTDDPDRLLSGRLFLLSTTRRALQEIVGLWNRYRQDPRAKMPSKLGAWKVVFPLIKDLRFWGAEDRLQADVRALWEDRIAAGAPTVRFEIETWCYASAEKNRSTTEQVTALVESAGGTLLSRALVSEISYHGFLVEMPSDALAGLLGDAPPELLLSERIMYFRPRGQAIAPPAVELEAHAGPPPTPSAAAAGAPVIAVLDGLPLENHPRLAQRLIIDDPEDWASAYPVNARRHGTSVASLVAWGEITPESVPLTRPIYVRPIMRPDSGMADATPECTPDDRLLIDLIHRAVVRMFDGEGDAPPAAPTTKIINLSVGDPYRPFDGSALSAWARLLDWLSHKYKVLFIISAGNNNDELALDLPRETLSQLGREEQARHALTALLRQDMHRRLFAPAEALNGITVGAQHADSSAIQTIASRPIPFLDGGVAPYSCIGPGYRRSVKPDILVPGGRVRYSERMGTPADSTRIRGLWDTPAAPGLAAACPPVAPGEDIHYVRGTSFAAAIASRWGGMAHDVIEALRGDNPEGIPAHYDAVLIKALLVHGSAWGSLPDQLSACKPGTEDRHQVQRLAARYAGYGVVDLHRALTCTEQRATLIGIGELKNEKAVEFKVRVPLCLHALPRQRRLTLTLAWLSPVNPRHSRYRAARLWLDPPTQLLDLKRSDVDYRQVRNGTVQHEVLQGTRAVALLEGQELIFTVNCMADAARLVEPVQFALCATLEVAEELALPIYEEIRQGIQPRMPIQA